MPPFSPLANAITPQSAEPGKPAGSVHGASVGVHACDAANAWRNIARVSNARNSVASLIVGAFHTGGQGVGLAGPPRPLPEHLEAVKAKDADTLLSDAEAAIRDKDQGRACAIVHRYGELGHPPRSVFDGIVKTQQSAQPFVYPKGLIEVPMSPISDIGAFRNGRWKLAWFLKAIRLGVEWAIDNKATFDFLGHPSCLYVTDP